MEMAEKDNFEISPVEIPASESRIPPDIISMPVARRGEEGNAAWRA